MNETVLSIAMVLVSGFRQVTASETKFQSDTVQVQESRLTISTPKMSRNSRNTRDRNMNMVRIGMFNFFIFTTRWRGDCQVIWLTIYIGTTIEII